MGIRCYQHVGLKEGAEKWLDENVARVPVPEHTCSKCGHVDTKEVWDLVDHEQVDCFMGDGPFLSIYNMKNGGVVKVVLQAEPWSSGPMGFLCLEVDGKRMFEWTEDEINERM